MAFCLLSTISSSFKIVFRAKELITANVRMQGLVQVLMGRPYMYECEFDCLSYDACVLSHSLSAVVRTGQYLEHLASFNLLLSMEPSERISRPPLEKYITHIRILRQSCSKKIHFFNQRYRD